MSCNVLSSKDPSEKVVVTFDYSPALDSGETLTGIVGITVETSAGVDPNPGDILDGASMINADAVSISQPVARGLDGVNYSIKAICNTSNASKRLALTAILPVRNQ